MSAALDCRDVWFAYGRGEAIIRGATFSLQARDVALLWGANGAGKTTLGKILAGLLRPRKGRVEVTAGGRCGMVLAEPEKMLLGATPYEDVRLGPAFAKLPAAEIEQLTRSALERVGLADRADDAVGALSLGEKKRVALAAALAAAPAALVLDEPFAFLDDEQVEGMWGSIESVAAAGTAVLILSGRAAHGSRCGRRLAVVDGVIAP